MCKRFFSLVCLLALFIIAILIWLFWYLYRAKKLVLKSWLRYVSCIFNPLVSCKTGVLLGACVVDVNYVFEFSWRIFWVIHSTVFSFQPFYEAFFYLSHFKGHRGKNSPVGLSQSSFITLWTLFISAIFFKLYSWGHVKAVYKNIITQPMNC